MSPRIVLFGATGYTGRLTARALVDEGARPVLAGRDAGRLGELAGELGLGDPVVADVARPETVRSLVEPGDVLISTVGPFMRWGTPALEAAVEAGAVYLDSTGEPPFVRSVFEEYGPRAERTGATLLTAFGYDYVPGNLAGALALRRAGEGATAVDIGYFATGDVRRGASAGTAASAFGVLGSPGFRWSGGALRTERASTRVGTFTVRGRRLDGMPVGGSEHFALPTDFPALREVGVYLGGFGPATRLLAMASPVATAATALPGARSLLTAVQDRMIKSANRDPDAAANLRAHVVAVARDEAGRPLAEVRLTGIEPYDFTARMLTWAASRLAEQGPPGAGAYGPVGAFGIEALESACRQTGLAVVDV